MKVRFTIDVEYGDWWNADIGEWMPPEWWAVKNDASELLNNFCGEVLKLSVNDDILYERQ